jgi:hypothetical protein
MHQLGVNGYLQVASADPDMPLSSILPSKAIAANPAMADQTAGQYTGGLPQSPLEAPSGSLFYMTATGPVPVAQANQPPANAIPASPKPMNEAQSRDTAFLGLRMRGIG